MNRKVIFINGCSTGIGRALAEAFQVGATPAGEFAQKLVNAVMVKNPPEIIRIGNMSTTMPLMKKWLPTGFLDRLLKKKFGLT